jgi:hypothetical protein
MPRSAAAQASSPARTGSGVRLGQNFPNPFNPETRIPFTLGDFPSCSEPGRQFRVSLRILNTLAQVVAVPVLQGGAGNVAGGQPLDNLQLACGQYTAFWDGKYRGTQREAASGVYIYQLDVDGKRYTQKMLVTK